MSLIVPPVLAEHSAGTRNDCASGAIVDATAGNQAAGAAQNANGHTGMLAGRLTPSDNKEVADE